MNNLTTTSKEGDIIESIPPEIEILATAFALYDGCDISFAAEMNAPNGGPNYNARISRARNFLRHLRNVGWELRRRSQ